MKASGASFPITACFTFFMNSCCLSNYNDSMSPSPHIVQQCIAMHQSDNPDEILTFDSARKSMNGYTLVFSIKDMLDIYVCFDVFEGKIVSKYYHHEA